MDGSVRFQINKQVGSYNAPTQPNKPHTSHAILFKRKM